MDSDKLRPAKGATNNEGSTWKSVEFRKRVLKKITDTVIKHGSRARRYNLSDALKVAEKFEAMVYNSATDENDYLSRIGRKLKVIEASSQSATSQPLASSSRTTTSGPGAEERAEQIDWQELLYQKVQMLKSTYLAQLNITYQHICSKLQQCDSDHEQMKMINVDRYKNAKKAIEDVFMHLRVTKSQITPAFKETLDRVEKNINILVPRKYVSSHQQGQGSADVYSMQQSVPSHSRISQVELVENKPKLQVMTLQSSHLNKKTPQQNKMLLQEKSAKLVSEQWNSVKLFQQIAKKSSKQQENQLSLVKGDTGINCSENLPSSSCANDVRVQTSGALKSNSPFVISTPGMSASPLLGDCSNLNETSQSPAVTSDDTSPAMQHLVKVLTSISPKALSASIGEVEEVVYLTDNMSPSALVNKPKCEMIPDSVEHINAGLQAECLTCHEFVPRRKIRCCTNLMGLETTRVGAGMYDSFKQFTDAEKPYVSSVTPQVKRPKFEAKCSLLEEVREINKLLMDTEVVVSGEDTSPSAPAGVAENSDGFIVKCFFKAVTVNLNLMSIIKPLQLLVPTSYPFSSPILLDEMPLEISKDLDDLSLKAKLKLRCSLRSLMQPFSLVDIAVSWERCTREVICEYARNNGGGTFSSKYGTWEKCLNDT